MTGQPNIPGWIEFDVSNLEVTKEPGLDPNIIVDKDDPFDLTATFDGDGLIWTVLELISDFPGIKVVGKVSFSAEGIGQEAEEEDFEPAEVILQGAGGPYTATVTVPGGELDVGVYQMACQAVIELRTDDDSEVLPIPGVTGHYVGLGANEEYLSAYEH
jgi:hypothetical protein